MVLMCTPCVFNAIALGVTAAMAAQDRSLHAHVIVDGQSLCGTHAVRWKRICHKGLSMKEFLTLLESDKG